MIEADPPDFDVTPGSVTAGAVVTFDVRNGGKQPHSFIVVPSVTSKSPEYVNVTVQGGGREQPGMTVPTGVSSLYYYCDINCPGGGCHEDAGMKGTLSVN